MNIFKIIALLLCSASWTVSGNSSLRAQEKLEEHEFEEELRALDELEDHEFEGRGLEDLGIDGVGRGRCRQYRARFDGQTGAISGAVQVRQCSRSKGAWSVRIRSFNDTQCTLGTYNNGGLNWHIHAAPVNAQGECSSTGGHYDPTFACGVASEHASTVCGDLLGSRPGYDYGAECTTATQDGCEIGDLSGKMGKIEPRMRAQRFADHWLGTLDKIDGLSIVVHCCVDLPTGGTSCSEKIACANLEPRW